MAVREVRRIAIGFSSPRRIAVDPQGSVYLAAGNAVHQLGGDGESIWNVDLSRPVRCLCVADNLIYVGNRDSVFTYDRQSGDRQKHRILESGNLIGDVVKTKDALYVTDVTAGSVIRYDDGRTGLQTVTLGITSSDRIAAVARGGFTRTDPARHRIVMAGDDGRVLGTWGKRARTVDGFQGCCNPMAAVELSDGSWVTAEAGQVRIKRFDSSGRFVSLIAGPDSIAWPAVSDQDDPLLNCGVGGIDLAVSPDDDLWVLHSAAKQLIHYRVS